MIDAVDMDFHGNPVAEKVIKAVGEVVARRSRSQAHDDCWDRPVAGGCTDRSMRHGRRDRLTGRRLWRREGPTLCC